MKKLFSRLSPALLFLAGLLLSTAAPSFAQYGNDYDYDNGYYDDGNYGNGNSYYRDFYDDLAPHGRWYNDPQYGYVWCPNAGADFQPYYSNGYWMMTDYGNTWVSNYSWGWAPFHYGRWMRGAYGWAWIPGNVWGPAWVSWRTGGSNFGWAPMGPGISVQASFGWNAPIDWWVFIPQAQIYNRGFHSYYRGPRYNNTYINQTTIINNTYINNRRTYVSGPGRRDLERAGLRSVPTYNVRDGRRPGAPVVGRREVNFYRPAINRTPRAAAPDNRGRGAATPGQGPRGGFRNNPATAPQQPPVRAEMPQRGVPSAPRSENRPRSRFDSQPAQPAPDRRPDFNNPAVGQPGREGRRGWNRQAEQERRPDFDRQPAQAPQRGGWNRQPQQAPPQREWNRPQQRPQMAQPAPQNIPERSMQRQQMNRPAREASPAIRQQPGSAPEQMNRGDFRGRGR